MLRPPFQRAFAQSTALAALSLGLFLNAFGQNAQTSKCAAEDYECYVAGYTTAIKANPNNAEYYESRGASYVKLKRFDEALQDYNTFINLSPKSNLGYIGRGYVYQLQGLYVEAVIELNKAIKIDPKDSYALDLHRYCLAWIGKSNSAIEDYGKLIEFDPNKADYYNERAAKYLQFKDFNRAVEDSSKAVELEPKYTDAYLTRAQGFCRLVKKKESESDIAKYEELSGKSLKYGCILEAEDCATNDYDCQIFAHTDRISILIKENARFLMISDNARLKTDLSDEYSDRGYAYYKKGDYDSALDDFNKSIGKYAVYRDRLSRGDIYLRKGKYNEALIDFQKALSGHPNSGEANLGIGEVYLHQNYYEAALEYFNQAIALNPHLDKAYFGRGTIYLKFGENFEQSGRDEDKSKAVESYRKAIKDFDAVIDIALNNAPPETYLKRADVYEKLGESEKAASDRAKYQELSEKP